MLSLAVNLFNLLQTKRMKERKAKRKCNKSLPRTDFSLIWEYLVNTHAFKVTTGFSTGGFKTLLNHLGPTLSVDVRMASVRYNTQPLLEPSEKLYCVLRRMKGGDHRDIHLNRGMAVSTFFSF